MSSYGNITVSLNVLDNNEGKSKPLEKSIFIPNKTIDPIAEFDYSVNDEMVVRFDARYSLINDRDIKEFRWEFASGQNEVTNEPVLLKQFSANVKENVKLVVLDSSNREAMIEKEINVYSLKVADSKEQEKPLFSVSILMQMELEMMFKGILSLVLKVIVGLCLSRSKSQSIRKK